MAFTAGNTVFTPTSHGSINFTPWLEYFCRVTYLSMTLVISYDACQDYTSTRKQFYQTCSTRLDSQREGE